ncbi:PAS domain-containing sensor histidine kinase [Dyadobacter fermentans]|uniref:histidine kinase n=1 Tax=Dyadobacter fermentans (strain ATCC 700827 / DSM 18053 / CIP 107007 / KCTC 52180 / NS114) TaxID=471854 RepID=C6VYC9_DYAFD|nr:PAS domain-containing protein [Dyadobacter fermentans]ACT91608.1 PAS/PAC sensor signal transduction histidine kinase [Dyadobacter fermentans DSM 18053]
MDLRSPANDQFFHFIQGGGEMGALTRAFDWSATAIGPPEQWQQSLRTTLGIVLNSAFPMFLFWGDELICFYNDAFRPSLGAEGKHPALGKRGREVWPEIWDFIGPLLGRVMSSGEPVWFEDQLVPFFRNGRVEDIYWTFSYSPVYDDSGKINGVFVTCTETTQKVLMYNRLHDSERRFQNLVTDATVGIIVLMGTDMVVEIVNDAYGQVIDRSREELLDKPFFSVVPETEPHFRNIVEGVMRTGEPLYLYDHPYFVYVNGEKKEGYLNLVYQPYRGDDGRIQGVMVLCQEVTELVLAKLRTEQTVTDRTRELATANRHLQRSNAELAQFAYIASHDLQEPIRKVATFAQLLEGALGETTERQRNYLDKIKNASARMMLLIRDVLTFSQLSRDTDLVRETDLGVVLDNVVDDLELLIDQKHATVSYENLPVVEAVPLQMSQLFGNLISNALKFTRADRDPVIRITAKLLDRQELRSYPMLDTRCAYHHLQVSDNGIGFDQSYAEQIFEIFQRLHGKKDFEGTGIGLAMCKKILQNHHGLIFATSGEGEGATFHMLIPENQSCFADSSIL